MRSTVKGFKIILSVILLGALSVASKAQINAVQVESIVGTSSGSNVVAGPAKQTYEINITYVTGIAAPSWYAQYGLALYDGQYMMDGNFVYGDSDGNQCDCSTLRITKYSPPEIDAFTRVVYPCALSPGIFAFYDTAYFKITRTIVNDAPKTLVDFTIKNYKGQVCLHSSGYLNQ